MKDDYIRLTKPIKMIVMSKFYLMTITFQYLTEVKTPVDIRRVSLKKFWVLVTSKEADIQTNLPSQEQELTYIFN